MQQGYEFDDVRFEPVLPDLPEDTIIIELRYLEYESNGGTRNLPVYTLMAVGDVEGPVEGRFYSQCARADFEDREQEVTRGITHLVRERMGWD